MPKGGSGVNFKWTKYFAYYANICSSGNLEHRMDFSDAIQILNCLDSMWQLQPKVTTKLLVLTFRGSKSNAVISKGLENVNEYGKGKNKFSEKGLLKCIQCLIIEILCMNNYPLQMRTAQHHT